MPRAVPFPTFLPAYVNGDGRMDVTRSLGNDTFGWRANSNGVLWPSYQTPLSGGMPLPWNGTSALAVTVADVDGDGRSEVLMGGGVVGNPSPAYGVHHSVGGSQSTISINLTGIADGNGFIFGQRLDANGDGLADMMVTEEAPTRAARVWANLGRTSLNQASFLPVSDVNPDFAEGLIADLNQDGMDDVL